MYISRSSVLLTTKISGREEYGSDPPDILARPANTTWPGSPWNSRTALVKRIQARLSEIENAASGAKVRGARYDEAGPEE